MRAIENSFSVVAVGAWNPAIFNGQWLTDNILVDKTNQITFSVPSNFLPHQMQQPLQVELEGVRIYPSPARLQICAGRPDLAGAILAANTFCNILQLLRHTPVQSVGVNFGFEVHGDRSKIATWLAHNDAMGSAPAGLNLNSSQATRNFVLNQNEFLNVTANLSDTHAAISFNFDLGSHPVDWYLDTINESKVTSCHQEALKFSNEVFDLEEDDG